MSAIPDIEDSITSPISSSDLGPPLFINTPSDHHSSEGYEETIVEMPEDQRRSIKSSSFTPTPSHDAETETPSIESSSEGPKGTEKQGGESHPTDEKWSYADVLKVSLKHKPL